MQALETKFWIFVGMAVVGAIIFAVAIVAASRKK